MTTIQRPVANRRDALLAPTQAFAQAQTHWRPRSPQPRLRPVETPHSELCLQRHGATRRRRHSPALRGPEFRATWLGALRISYSRSRNLPPATPARSAPPNRRGNGIPQSQNQLVAADKPVSSNPDELKGMLLPERRAGQAADSPAGSGSTAPEGESSRPPAAVTDALLANPPASGWPRGVAAPAGVQSPCPGITK
jgi:hypothetical protein